MMHGQKNIKLKLLRVATFCTSGSEEVVYTHTHTHTHIYIYMGGVKLDKLRTSWERNAERGTVPSV